MSSLGSDYLVQLGGRGMDSSPTETGHSRNRLSRDVPPSNLVTSVVYLFFLQLRDSANGQGQMDVGGEVVLRGLLVADQGPSFCLREL